MCDCCGRIEERMGKRIVCAMDRSVQELSGAGF